MELSHPDEHPPQTYLGFQRVVELCGLPISTAGIESILQKRFDAYQVPLVPVAAPPANSRVYAKRHSTASKKRRADFEGHDDDDDEAVGGLLLSGMAEDNLAWTATTRRKGPRLQWSKELGNNPVVEDD